MRPSKGFTLAELLAVIAIMLFLMVAAFGVYGTLAQRMGPDNAMATIQAMLNGARDCAATNGTYAKVVFTTDPNNVANGTVMTLMYWYKPVGSNTYSWQVVPGTLPVALHNQLIVHNGMPTQMPTVPPQVVSNAQDPNATSADQTVTGLWKTYETDCLTKVDAFVMSGGKPNETSFRIIFDPSGYMCNLDPDNAATPAYGAPYAMTIFQVAGNKVGGYAFYPINSISGTRIVFD
jgi:prepilin-type N-terminal cleavage/methylation domain-containing protein